MQPEAIQSITSYVAWAVPITVAISSISKVLLEWLKQKHAIDSSRIDQNHQITAHYLDRALDPNVPLAIRHQLLRFLSTPDKSGTRLQAWAESELKRVGGIVEETNKAVATAEAEIQKAKNSAEIANAERKLADAVRRQKSLLEPPVMPPVTIAALKAGLVDAKELNGLSMPGENLSGVRLHYRQLRGCDFSNGVHRQANFQGSDLRAANFSHSDLEGSEFYAADLRGADFTGAKLNHSQFQKSRLEGANFTDTSLDRSDMRATFDKTTVWPKDFDPTKAGAVLVES